MLQSQQPPTEIQQSNSKVKDELNNNNTKTHVSKRRVPYYIINPKAITKTFNPKVRRELSRSYPVEPKQSRKFANPNNNMRIQSQHIKRCIISKPACWEPLPKVTASMRPPSRWTLHQGLPMQSQAVVATGPWLRQPRRPLFETKASHGGCQSPPAAGSPILARCLA